MSIINFFNIYGEVIIGVTLIFLLITYWFLIYRILKLEHTMKKFDQRFEKLETTFGVVRDSIIEIVEKIKKFEMLKTAGIKFDATTPLGPIKAEIALAKLFQKKIKGKK